MISLKGIDDSHVYEIAEAFADAFLAEEGVVSWSLGHEDAVQYFYITLRAFAKHGGLYTTSEEEEGYIVWYRRGRGLPWYRDLWLTAEYMFHMTFEGLQKMITVRNGWQDYTLYHEHTPDYVDVCLVCVRLEYQHHGILRQLLAMPFAEADEHGLITILDTDSEKKMKKYEHEGMTAEKDAVLKSGVHMYTMIRQPAGKENG